MITNDAWIINLKNTIGKDMDDDCDFEKEAKILLKKYEDELNIENDKLKQYFYMVCPYFDIISKSSAIVKELTLKIDNLKDKLSEE